MFDAHFGPDESGRSDGEMGRFSPKLLAGGVEKAEGVSNSTAM